MYGIYTGLFFGLNSILLCVIAFNLLGRSKQVFRYVGIAVAVTAGGYLFSMLGYLTFQLSPLLSSILNNLISNLFVYVSYSIFVFAFINMNFNVNRWVAVFPTLVGIAALIYVGFNFPNPTVDSNGFVDWHQPAIEEYLRMMWTFVAGGVVSYTFFSTFHVFSKELRRKTLALGGGIIIFALFAAIAVVNKDPAYFWLLHSLTTGGIVLTLFGLLYL